MSWWRFWTGRGDAWHGTPDYYTEGVELAREERYHEALTSFRLALRERPEDTAVLEQMGVVYTRIGMTDEALRSYRRALERDPDSPGAHYGIGFLLLNRGRPAEAREHLEAFLEGASPGSSTDRHIRHARETLERLEASPDGEPIPGPDPEP